MHLARSIGRLRRGAALTAVGIVLAAVTLGLSQCRMVDERLTGVSLSSTKPDACLLACFNNWKAAMDAERDTMKVHIANCGRDTLCLISERLRHDAAVDAIMATRKACEDACRHQGSGGGGR